MYKFLEQNDDDGLVYVGDDGKVVAAITMCTAEFQAMVDGAPDLLKAGQMVLENWENGDLAAAVRALSEAIARIGGQP